MRKKASEPEPMRRPYYSVHPWECRHHKDHSELTAYVEASGKWEVVAEIKNTSGHSAEMLATYLCDLINGHQDRQRLLHDAMRALQNFLEDEKITFTAEQEAEDIIRRIEYIKM